MTDFFQKNIAVLKKARPDLAASVENHIRASPPKPVARDAQGRFNLPASSGWLYGQTLENDLKGLPGQIQKVYNPQVMIWLGLGLGFHLNSYLAQPHPLNRSLIIVEPSLDYFCQFLNFADWGSLLAHPQAFWMVGLPQEKIEPKLVEVMRNPGFAESMENNLMVEWGYAHPSFAVFKETWKRLVEFARWENNVMPIDAYYGLMNFLQNRASLDKTPLAQEFKGVLNGKPGIVVSTGPSLTLSLDLLKGVGDKAFIFCVDSAFRILNKAGIVPHATGCIERVPATRRHFKDIETKNSYFFTTPVVSKETLDMFHGPTAYVVRSHHFLPSVFPFAEWHDCGISSVSQWAIYVLWLLGCRPIYLLGQDLAFDPKTQSTHASGYGMSTDKAGWEEMGYQMVKVPSNRGDTIITEEMWHIFAQQTTHMIQQLGIECHNIIPKDYGIAIPGTTRLDPEEAFGRFQESFDSRALLHRALEKFNSERKPVYENSVGESFASFSENVTSILGEAEQISRRIHAQLDQLTDKLLSKSELAKSELEAVHSLMRRLEEEAEGMMKNPTYAKFLYPVVAGKHGHLIQKSYLLLAEDDTRPDTLRSKLSISLAWFAEIVVRSRMTLSLLKRQTN